MYKSFPGKTPTQMRREAEHLQQPLRSAPAAPVDPAKYPRLRSDDGGEAEANATREWLAHIAAGRIEVK